MNTDSIKRIEEILYETNIHLRNLSFLLACQVQGQDIQMDNVTSLYVKSIIQKGI